MYADQTYKATVEQIKFDFKDEADKILKSRFRIIKSALPVFRFPRH